MAQLTSELPDDTRGKAIIAPAAPAPSIFGAAAELGASLTVGGAEAYQRNLQINNVKAGNELAGGMFNIQQGVAQQNNGAAIINQEMLDQSIGQSADAINKVKQAAMQGRVPQEAIDAQVESMVSGLMAKYPDQRKYMADQFQSLGIDHYLFRAQQNQTAQSEQDATEALQIRHANILRGQNSDLYHPGLSDDDTAELGRQLGVAQFHLDQSKELSEINKNRAETDDLAYKKTEALRSSADKAGLSSLMSANWGVVNDMLSAAETAAASAPDQDAAFAKMDKEVMPLVIQQAQLKYDHVMQTYKSQPGAQPDVIEFMDNQFKEHLATITQMHTGPLAQRSLNQEAYKSLQATLGLDDAHALPLLSRFTKIVPPQALVQLLGADPNLGFSADYINQLKGELKSADPLNPGRAVGMLLQAKAVMAGDTSFSSLKESDITPDMLRNFNATATGLGGAIASNPTKAPDGDKLSFIHSIESLGITATKIQPGYKNLDGLDWITGAVQRGSNQAALTSLLSDPKFGQQAQDAMTATRAGAETALEVARGYSSQLDFKNGQFVPKPTQTQTQPTNMREGSTMYQTPTVDPGIQRQANIMNAAIKYLTSTAKYDPNIPKGVQQAELIGHYAFGTPLQQPAAAKTPSKNEIFDKNVDNLEKFLATDSAQTSKNLPYTSQTAEQAKANKAQYEPVVAAAATKHGVPPALSTALVDTIENKGWDPHAENHGVNGSSHAGGLMQIQPGTMEMMGYKGIDRFDPEKNADAGNAYLAALHAKHGNWHDAIKEYGGPNTYTEKQIKTLSALAGE